MFQKLAQMHIKNWPSLIFWRRKLGLKPPFERKMTLQQDTIFGVPRNHNQKTQTSTNKPKFTRKLDSKIYK